MSARRSIAQQPATPPVHAPHAPQPAAPAGLALPHRPSRLQPRPTSAAGASVQPGWDDAVQPQTQQPSPGQFANEATPSVDRNYIADIRYGAAQPPHARSVQQPLTQLPSPGYDDTPVSQWPQQPPQLGRPVPVQDASRGAHARAYSWEMPAGSAAQQEEFDISGHHLGVQRSREQRQWPGQQEAPQSRPVSGGSRNGFERGADNAAAAAQREWLPGAQGMPFSAAHGQGMRSVMHPGQPQSWVPSAALRETGHVQQHQQDFSFPRQRPEPRHRSTLPHRTMLHLGIPPMHHPPGSQRSVHRAQTLIGSKRAAPSRPVHRATNTAWPLRPRRPTDMCTGTAIQQVVSVLATQGLTQGPRQESQT